MDVRPTGRRTAVGITTAIGVASLTVTGMLSGIVFSGTSAAVTGSAESVESANGYQGV